MTSDHTPARSTSDLEALRAAMHRIEDGESTGLFDDLASSTPRSGPRRTRRAGRTDAAPEGKGARGQGRQRRQPTAGTPSGTPAQDWQGSAPPPESAPDWAGADETDDLAGAPESGSGGLGSDEKAGQGSGYEVGDAGAGDSKGGARGREPKSDTKPDSVTEPDSENQPESDADPYAVARQIVLRQLTMAPRSRHQLRQKLRQRNCPDDVAEAVLDRMTEVGLIDDEKYAEALVRSKQVSRGLSKRALAHELRAKGVDKDTADAVLDQVSPTEEEDRAKALVEARLSRLRGLDRDTVMRRLAGMLGRKGYPSGLSLQVIREAIDADPAFRRD